MSWVEICAHSDLPVDRGVCALVGNQPVALFRVGSGEVYALSNIDPFSGASVMSRGLVGSRRDADGFDIPKVASPMYKQSFELRTGICIDDPDVFIAAFAVSVIDDRVLVSVLVSSELSA
jgi:nitrite reductase (NADH) small subunit